MSELTRLRETEFPMPEAALKFQRISLVVGVLGAIGCVVGAVLMSGQQFMRAYLVGCMDWLGVSLGCMAILMVSHVTTAQWGFVVRRILEAGSMTTFLMALLFIPVLVGAPRLYLWAQAEALAHDAIVQHQAPYMNMGSFIVRAFLYFAAWCLLAYTLNRLSWRQDTPPDKELRLRFQNLSAMGLVVYAFTMTFASIDWMMSLEPHWHSTIYGFYIMAGQGLMGFAFLILMAAIFMKHEPLQALITRDHMHDYGKLMFTFVILWAYMAFSQGLIYWSANLPSEISWYLDRTNGAWWIVGMILLFGHFVVPFILLLGQDIKRQPGRIAALAVWMMCMRWLDLFWLIIPNFADTKGRFDVPSLVMSAVASCGIGGLWLVVFFHNLKLRPLVVRHDPMLAHILEGEHGH